MYFIGYSPLPQNCNVRSMEWLTVRCARLISYPSRGEAWIYKSWVRWRSWGQTPDRRRRPASASASRRAARERELNGPRQTRSSRSSSKAPRPRRRRQRSEVMSRGSDALSTASRQRSSRVRAAIRSSSTSTLSMQRALPCGRFGPGADRRSARNRRHRDAPLRTRPLAGASVR